MPTAPILSSPAAITDELQSLREFFFEAQEDLRSGCMANMSGIEQRVYSLCQAVQAAPRDAQEQYLLELSSLIEMLSDYEAELRAMQDSVETASVTSSAQGSGNG